MTEAPRRYRAVVFDMDGVLVDSEPAFFEALNEVLVPTGKQIEWEVYQQFLGTSVSVTWRGVLEHLALEAKAEDYVEPYTTRLVEVLGRPRPLLPGVAELLAGLERRDVPVAVATSSWQEWVDAVFTGVGLLVDSFGAVVWRQMVERSKPAPDLYLKAAELLGVPPDACIAVEDTPSGIAAAKAAGMYAIQVRSASTALPPIADADLVLETLEDFPLEILHRM